MGDQEPIKNPPPTRVFTTYSFKESTINISVPRLDQDGQEIDQENFEMAVQNLPPEFQEQAVELCNIIAKLHDKIDGK